MHRVVKAAAAVSAAVAIAAVVSTAAMGGKGDVKVLRATAQGTLKAPTAKVAGVTKTFPTISDSTVVAARAAINAQDDREEASDAQAGTTLGLPDLGQTQGTIGCGRRESAGNSRVNQDCTFRRQAEEDITVNPLDSQNLIAGQNDSRVGFNQCGIDFSTDGGRHWGDMLPPFRQRFNDPTGLLTTPANTVNSIRSEPGTLHTYDAGSDPAVAVDSAGRAFFSCVVFDVNSNASGLFVTGSPAGAQGSFYSNIPSAGKSFMVVEDNGTAFHDKEFIAADAFAGSPNRDNVYVTWTVFLFDAAGNFQQSPIYGSMSTDHAVTWSKPEEISGANPAICQFGNTFDKTLNPNSCNFDQGSDPVVLPNGDLVVVFDNQNTPTIDAQQLAVHCSPSGSSTAGTAHFNCGSPNKIGDEVVTGEPFCDFGRGPEQCVPGAFIRTNGFPRVALGTKTGNLYTVWQDGRSGELDIQMSMSTDGGLTWSTTQQVNPDSGLDHYMPAVDVAEVGSKDRVAVSYYRNERVPNEETVPPDGFTPGRDPGTGELNADYVLAGSQDLSKPFDFKVVSPVFGAPNNPAQVGFNGDYSGIVVSGGVSAHPIWSDTRNTDPFLRGNPNEEDVFTDAVQVPPGPGTLSTGVLGRS